MEKCAILLEHGADAILCPGSSGGLLTAYALSEFGKRIPEDISIIASEVAFFSPFATPPQTTICPDYPAMASAVVDFFNAALEGKQSVSKLLLPCSLTVRRSVR